MTRINVVFSIGALHGGGSERQILLALRHLNRKEFAPILYLIYRHGPLLDQVPDDVPIAVFAERCKAPTLYWPGGMHRQRVSDMAKFLKEVRADVCYDRTFLMTLIAADAAQRAGVPNVSTVVTDPELGFAPVAGRFQLIKKRRLRRLYGNSSKVMAVSNGAARSAERFYGLKPDSVQTLYNGVDVGALQAAADSDVDDPWWTAAGDGRPVFRIVSAGRLNREKGFHLLIDAVRQLQQQKPTIDFRLAILGDGPDGRQHLEQQTAALDLSNTVHLPGFRTDAAAWYASADLYVLSSLLEGMPNVLLEAMAVQTPVLATDCPSGPAEILDNGTCGLLCEPGSATALSQGIHAILQDPKNAAMRSERAALRVKECFSVQSAVSRLQTILADCSHTFRTRQKAR
ncbi:MAG: glycosyltransferase [Planctomycetaceae bacterium]